MTTSDTAHLAPAAEVLSNAWQAALGKAPSGPGADFFAAGGDSLLVVRMVSRIRKAGLTVAIADVLRGRTFDGILSRIDSAAPAGPPTSATKSEAGAVALLPSQRRWIANRFADPDHFSLGWIFDVPERTPDGRDVDAGTLETAVRILIMRHEALRTRYLIEGEDTPRAEVLSAVPDGFFTVADVTDEDVRSVLTDGFRSHQLAEGRVSTARWLPVQRLLQIAVHHLTLDGFSIEILADDLEDLITGGESTQAPAHPSGQAPALSRWLATTEAERDAEAWEGQAWQQVRPIPTELAGTGLLSSMDLVSAELGPRDTAAVEQLAGQVGLGMESLVLAAAGTAIKEQFGLAAVSVDTYHHGRDALSGGPDLTTGIGYFQSNYPVVLSGGVDGWLGRAVTQLNAVPKNRFGFDALRFAGHTALQELPSSGVRLNFRSRMNAINARTDAWLVPSRTSVGGRRSPQQTEPYVIMLEGDQIGDRLTVNIKYSQDHYTRQTVDRLVQRTTALLVEAAARAWESA